MGRMWHWIVLLVSTPKDGLITSRRSWGWRRIRRRCWTRWLLLFGRLDGLAWRVFMLDMWVNLRRSLSENCLLISYQTNHFNIGAIMQTGIRLIGNGQAPVHRYWEHLLDLVRRKEIEPLKIVTHRVRLEDMEKLYQQFEKRENGIQKVFVATKYSAPPCPGAPALTELWVHWIWSGGKDYLHYPNCMVYDYPDRKHVSVAWFKTCDIQWHTTRIPILSKQFE